MPSLYERLAGVHATRPSIPMHQFQAAIGEVVRAKMTVDQVSVLVAAVSGEGLDATERLEFSDLVATVPTGTTTAQQLSRALRLTEIDQVLLLSEHTVNKEIAPLANSAAVRTRLGVVTR